MGARQSAATAAPHQDITWDKPLALPREATSRQVLCTLGELSSIRADSEAWMAGTSSPRPSLALAPSHFSPSLGHRPTPLGPNTNPLCASSLCHTGSMTHSASRVSPRLVRPWSHRAPSLQAHPLVQTSSHTPEPRGGHSSAPCCRPEATVPSWVRGD